MNPMLPPGGGSVVTSWSFLDLLACMWALVQLLADAKYTCYQCSCVSAGLLFNNSCLTFQLSL